MGRLRPTWLLLPAVALGGLGPSWTSAPALADVSSEARSAADVYERKSTLADCLAFVASDLKVRTEAAGPRASTTLLLVVEASSAMKPELGRLAEALPSAWEAGPLGMAIGVMGVGAETTAPSPIPMSATSALRGLAALPADGPKNLMASVREGAALLAHAAAGPRALVLVTKTGGDAEDDVESTRETLTDAGVAFYAIAPEAAFERAWSDGLDDKVPSEAGLPRRFIPELRRKERGSVFVGGDVAFGLVPYRWEMNLAQAEFVWLRAPAWPVPSGYGYWSLATLAFSTGGRYFVFDYTAAAAAAAGTAPKTMRTDARKTLYDYGRLRLLAPDLRSRDRVLKDLEKNSRAQTILRIWQHLADEACPIVRDLATIERTGSAAMSTLQPRVARAVRSQWYPPPALEDQDAVRSALSLAQTRIASLDKALDWWSQTNAHEAKDKPTLDPLTERVEADFLLLGVQLMKVRFAWGELEAALKDIKPLDLSYRRVRIVPFPIASGVEPPAKPVKLGDPERDGRFAELMATQERLARKYADTPWALILAKGHVVSFRKDVQVLDPDPTAPGTTDPKSGKGSKTPPKPPAAPVAPPPPGPRPGSGGSGPTTGG